MMRHAADKTRAYAKIANDTHLEADAHEIWHRAERKLGEMMREQPKAKPPGRPPKAPKKEIGSRQDPTSEKPITLHEAGIDKHLAHAARKAAAMPEEKFETTVAAERHCAGGFASRCAQLRRGAFGRALRGQQPVAIVPA
jgi:hypothetical protein